MKKKTVINFVVIVGLLIMSVVTLMAVYSTAPETILLFEENFESLDEKKWERHTRDCRVKSGLHNYDSNSENNTNAGCVRGVSTTFKTKNSFQVKHGKIEVRLKLPLDNSLKASIGIVLSNATLEYENSLEGFKIIETVGGENKNGSTEFELFFGPSGNQTFMERKVTKADFHVYEFEWVNDYVEFKIDGVKAMKFQLDKMKNSTLKEDEFFGRPEKNVVAAEEFLNLFKNSTNVESIMVNGSSGRGGSGGNAANNSALVVDYVKLYKKID